MKKILILLFTSLSFLCLADITPMTDEEMGQETSPIIAPGMLSHEEEERLIKLFSNDEESQRLLQVLNQMAWEAHVNPFSLSRMLSEFERFINQGRIPSQEAEQINRQLNTMEQIQRQQEQLEAQRALFQQFINYLNRITRP
ncbi:MAG: hypothetical protein AB7I27_19335 [Bacteriovoracaceae bacterium]